MPSPKTRKTKKIAAVPQGFRRVTTQLTVADVAAASAFYAKAFGAVESDRVTAPDTDTALFAQLKLGDSLLLLVTGYANQVGAVGVTLHQYIEDLDEVWKSAIDAGCFVITPLYDAYWGERIGVLQDPFGYRWSLGKRVERVNSRERGERLAALHAPAVAAEDPKGTAMDEIPASIDETALWPAGGQEQVDRRPCSL